MARGPEKIMRKINCGDGVLFDMSNRYENRGA